MPPSDPVRILGIDPGLNGAAAIYWVQPQLWKVVDLPTVGDSAQRRINAPALREWIMGNGGASGPHHAFIESVHALPKEAASFSFRYGRAIGALEATVACWNIPMTLVVPQQWKRFYNLRGPDKEQSRALAIRRFPTASGWLERKKDHGRAEAMLIAYFGAAAVGAVRSMSPLDAPHEPARQRV